MNIKKATSERSSWIWVTTLPNPVASVTWFGIEICFMDSYCNIFFYSFWRKVYHTFYQLIRQTKKSFEVLHTSIKDFFTSFDTHTWYNMDERWNSLFKVYKALRNKWHPLIGFKQPVGLFEKRNAHLFLAWMNISHNHRNKCMRYQSNHKVLLLLWRKKMQFQFGFAQRHVFSTWFYKALECRDLVRNRSSDPSSSAKWLNK